MGIDLAHKRRLGYDQPGIIERVLHRSDKLVGLRLQALHVFDQPKQNARTAQRRLGHCSARLL
jgi:hypothetical protein